MKIKGWKKELVDFIREFQEDGIKNIGLQNDYVDNRNLIPYKNEKLIRGKKNK